MLFGKFYIPAWNKNRNKKKSFIRCQRSKKHDFIFLIFFKYYILKFRQFKINIKVFVLKRKIKHSELQFLSTFLVFLFSFVFESSIPRPWLSVLNHYAMKAIDECCKNWNTFFLLFFSEEAMLNDVISQMLLSVFRKLF